MRAVGIIAAFNVGGFLVTTAIKSEVVTDLLGTGSIGLSALAIAAGGSSCGRTIVAASAIGIWSARLASFLAYRAALYGDERLQKFLPPVDPATGAKESWSKHPKRLKSLAIFWSLQAVWGLAMLFPLMLTTQSPVSRFAGWPGLCIAAAGFAIEAVADYQKFVFKSKSNELMTSGLYKIVQYPNYSGEILFWIGLGVYWASALPLVKMPLAFLPAAFATLLLTKVSGIPFSERSRAKRLANDDKFKEYSKKTSKLVPGLY